MASYPKKHSICLISPSLQMGGLERAMSNLANYFCGQGHDVIYVVLYRFDKFYRLDERIKIIEPMARRKSKERYQADGVICEALYSFINISCNLRINSQLKRDIIGFKKSARYLKKVISESDGLDELIHANFQEAALAAIAELPSEE